jgi:hypothetical protein
MYYMRGGGEAIGPLAAAVQRHRLTPSTRTRIKHLVEMEVYINSNEFITGTKQIQ